MKISISDKVPFSSLKPGDRGSINGKPFLCIAALIDPTVSCGGTVSAVSLENGRPMCIYYGTMVEHAPTRVPGDPAPGDVWIDADGDYLIRVVCGGGVDWVDLQTGIAYSDSEVDHLHPIDVQLVRA